MTRQYRSITVALVAAPLPPRSVSFWREFGETALRHWHQKENRAKDERENEDNPKRDQVANDGRKPLAGDGPPRSVGFWREFGESALRHWHQKENRAKEEQEDEDNKTGDQVATERRKPLAGDGPPRWVSFWREIGESALRHWHQKENRAKEEQEDEDNKTGDQVATGQRRAPAWLAPRARSEQLSESAGKENTMRITVNVSRLHWAVTVLALVLAAVAAQSPVL